jgi:hypothetical protein
LFSFPFSFFVFWLCASVMSRLAPDIWLLQRLSVICIFSILIYFLYRKKIKELERRWGYHINMTTKSWVICSAHTWQILINHTRRCRLQNTTRQVERGMRWRRNFQNRVSLEPNFAANRKVYMWGGGSRGEKSMYFFTMYFRV